MHVLRTTGLRSDAVVVAPSVPPMLGLPTVIVEVLEARATGGCEIGVELEVVVQAHFSRERHFIDPGYESIALAPAIDVIVSAGCVAPIRSSGIRTAEGTCRHIVCAASIRIRRGNARGGTGKLLLNPVDGSSRHLVLAHVRHPPHGRPLAPCVAHLLALPVCDDEAKVALLGDVAVVLVVELHAARMHPDVLEEAVLVVQAAQGVGAHNRHRFPAGEIEVLLEVVECELPVAFSIGLALLLCGSVAACAVLSAASEGNGPRQVYPALRRTAHVVAMSSPTAIGVQAPAEAVLVVGIAAHAVVDPNRVLHGNDACEGPEVRSGLPRAAKRRWERRGVRGEVRIRVQLFHQLHRDAEPVVVGKVVARVDAPRACRVPVTTPNTIPMQATVAPTCAVRVLQAVVEAQPHQLRRKAGAVRPTALLDVRLTASLIRLVHAEQPPQLGLDD
mmetsp:Transcript_137126/g.426109  ORF Transcript_137126/g.426109 Transcript_137126/m.426109 type:complete len:446 (-) Transcript_137126:364-1701(-)